MPPRYGGRSARRAAGSVLVTGPLRPGARTGDRRGRRERTRDAGGGGRGLRAAPQERPDGLAPQQGEQGGRHGERQDGAQPDGDPAQQREERVPAARERVQEAGAVVLAGLLLHGLLGQRQGEGGQAGAVLQGLLLGEQGLQVG